MDCQRRDVGIIEIAAKNHTFKKILVQEQQATLCYLLVLAGFLFGWYWYHFDIDVMTFLFFGVVMESSKPWSGARMDHGPRPYYRYRRFCKCRLQTIWIEWLADTLFKS